MSKSVKDSGEYFVINPTLRKVTVPHAHKAIGTVGDHNSEQVTFECPKTIDGHDVSKCARHYVTWVNADGDIGHDELQMVQVNQGTEGKIYLSWTIRNPLTVARGVIRFSIHFEDAEYRWSTTTCKDCDILDSINSVLGVYESIYVSGDALVIANYTPVTDGTLSLEANAIIPEGTMEITDNGTYDVREVAQVDVAVFDKTINKNTSLYLHNKKSVSGYIMYSYYDENGTLQYNRLDIAKKEKYDFWVADGCLCNVFMWDSTFSFEDGETAGVTEVGRFTNPTTLAISARIYGQNPVLTII